MVQIISKFKERPKNKATWWAMWLGVLSILSGPIMGTFAAVISPLITKLAGETAGMMAGFVMIAIVLALIISALIMSIRAYKQGERSWTMWVGLFPAVLGCTLWIIMIIGEFAVPH